MNFKFWKTGCNGDKSGDEYSFSLDSLETLDDCKENFGEVLVYAAKIHAILDYSFKGDEILIESRHINSAFGEILCEHSNPNPDS